MFDHIPAYAGDPILTLNESFGKDPRLEWTAPHGARFLVPRALLYLPTETA